MTRFHPILVTLHWLLAILIIVGLYTGSQVLSETASNDPFKLVALRMHMIMGTLILILMLIRLATRLATKKPPHADIGNGALNKLGVWTHWTFYLIVIAVCASGLAIANMAGLPGIIFGGNGMPVPEDFSIFPPRAAHGNLTSLLMLLIAGHIAAFLYHQFLRRDRLFSRMWFGKRRDGS